jgi:hypothetical protein
VHVAHAKDALGRQLATTSIPTTPDGYRRLLGWGQGLGEVQAWGVEGTGCYGAALTRFLHAHGQVVVEVNRPDRAARRRQGKCDPVDAEAAARAVQAKDATGLPKSGDAKVEMLRCLRVARSTAVKARTQAINALKALVVTAPEDLREQLRGLSATKLVRAAASLEPGHLDTTTAATKLACGPSPSATRPSAPRSRRWTVSCAGSSPRPPLACSSCSASAPRVPAPCWPPPATTLVGCTARRRSQCCAGPHRSRPPRARPPAIA